jgi:hypothetical protein
MAVTIYQSILCNIPEEQHLQKYADEPTIFMINGRGAPGGSVPWGTKGVCDIKVIWSMNAVFLQEILLVPQKGLQENQQKTSILAVYRMILMAEYLPSVWTI